MHSTWIQKLGNTPPPIKKKKFRELFFLIDLSVLRSITTYDSEGEHQSSKIIIMSQQK